MRIALHQTGEVGTRTGRILLAERRLERLGLVGQDPRRGVDPRVVPAGSLAGYDVYVSDDLEDPFAHAERALDAGISCVLWGDDGGVETLGAGFAERGRTLLVGASLSHGIAPTLASHETGRGDETLDVMYAWTEPGKPLRRGEAVPFPDPVGPRWGRLRRNGGSERRYAVPVLGEWAGAMTKVTAGTPDGVQTRIVGVADLATHLEALALAAGALTVDSFPPGLATTAVRSEEYLAAALDAGLGVAAYSVEAGAG